MIILIFSDQLPCIVSGWGSCNFTVGPKCKVNYIQPQKLQFLSMKVVDRKKCVKQHTHPLVNVISEGVICASARVNEGIGPVLLDSYQYTVKTRL